MASQTVEALKQKLLQYLDEENNVLNEEKVMKALELWEAFPVTREILETSRIGKYVNELRKKTNNKILARRAKDLVRKWQSAPSSASLVNNKVSTPPVNSHSVPGSVSTDDSPTKQDLSSITSSASNLLKSKLKSNFTALSKSTPSSPAITSLDPQKRVSNVSQNIHRASSTLNHSSKLSVSPSLTRTVEHKSAFSSLCVGEDSQSATSSVASLTDAGSRSCSPAGFTTVSQHNKRSAKSTTTPVPQRKRARVEERDESSNPEIQSKKSRSSTDVTLTRNKSEATLNGFVSSSYADRSTVKRSGIVEAVTSPHSSAVNGHRADRDLNGSSAYKSNGNSTVLNSLSKVHVDDVITSGLTSEPSTSKPRQAAPKLRKVETTAELMSKLHASGELRLWRSETVEKIASGQINKEKEVVNRSIVPDGVLPRPHNKISKRAGKLDDSNLCPGPPASPAGGLGKVKTEMVHKFLQMSVTASMYEGCSSADDSSPGTNNADLLSRLEYEPKPEDVVAFEFVNKKHKRSSDLIKNSLTDNSLNTSCTDTVEINRTARKNESSERIDLNSRSLDSLEALLPHYDPDEIDWSTTDTYDFLRHDELITDDDVKRLHEERLSGINGQYDSKGEWCDWTSMLTLKSSNGHMLHILPYVNVDD